MSAPKAVEYILQVYDQIPGFDELLQMAIIELIRKDCANESAYRVRGVEIVLYTITNEFTQVALYPMHI
jgi:coatomer subunit beta